MSNRRLNLVDTAEGILTIQKINFLSWFQRKHKVFPLLRIISHRAMLLLLELMWFKTKIYWCNESVWSVLGNVSSPVVSLEITREATYFRTNFQVFFSRVHLSYTDSWTCQNLAENILGTVGICLPFPLKFFLCLFPSLFQHGISFLLVFTFELVTNLFWIVFLTCQFNHSP